MDPYAEELRRLREQIINRAPVDPSLSDDAFLEASQRDAQNAGADRVSALIHSAASRRNIAPAQRGPGEADTLLRRRAMRREELADVPMRMQALQGARDEADDADPTWLSAARGLVGQIGGPESAELVKDLTSRRKFERLFPYVKELADVRRADRAAAAKLGDPLAPDAMALDVEARTKFPDRFQNPEFEAAWKGSGYKGRLELLKQWNSAEGREDQQEHGRSQMHTRTETDLAIAGAEHRARAAETTRKEIRQDEELIGAYNSFPKPGRRPTPQDAKAWNAAITDMRSMERMSTELAGLVAKYGTENLNTAVRSKMEQLVWDLSLKMKGHADLDLGVLAGPDMGAIRGIVPDPTTKEEVVADFFGRSTAPTKIMELPKRFRQGAAVAREKFGYAMPGDKDYSTARQAFETQPRAQAPDYSGVTVEGEPVVRPATAVPPGTKPPKKAKTPPAVGTETTLSTGQRLRYTGTGPLGGWELISDEEAP
jgi:hypothetical protein